MGIIDKNELYLKSNKGNSFCCTRTNCSRSNFYPCRCWKRIYGLDDIFGLPTVFKRCCSHKKLFKRKRTTVIRANCFWLSGFSERQAEREETMTMNDWAAHLDSILTMYGEKLLQTAGSISHDKAIEKATNEYKSINKKHQAK